MKKIIVTLLLATALLTGCGGAPVPPSPADNHAASAGSSPTSTPAKASTAGCLAAAPKPGADSRKVTVQRVVDGDTVELADGTKVRLIGMNTPESVDPRRPVQAYGKEASNYTKQLLENKAVLLTPGRTPKDKYDRLLAWLWLPDGTFVNGLLVRDGYAQVYTFSDNPDYADLLVACQREARDHNRGLWALPVYQEGGEAAKMDRQGAGTGTASSGSAGAASAPTGAGAVAIVREPGSVAKGSTATVAAKTTPGATCSITVTYKSGPSEARGLEPKQADSAGAVSWSWAISPQAASGTWPVAIHCNGATAQTNVTIP